MTEKSGQLNEAIKVLEELKRLSTVPIVIKSCINTKLLNEAIDTVVSEVEKPTYTAEDMVDFHRWMKEGIYKNKVGIRFNGEFVKYIEGIPVTLSTEQVIKLWEEQK